MNAVEIIRPQPELRLHAELIAERGLVGPQHFPHDLPRRPQLPADLLDALALSELRPADFGDRLHNQHPDLSSQITSGSTVDQRLEGVPFASRSDPKQGLYSTPIHNQRLALRGQVLPVGGAASVFDASVRHARSFR
jgi:hypothetical protein